MTEVRCGAAGEPSGLRGQLKHRAGPQWVYEWETTQNFNFRPSFKHPIFILILQFVDQPHLGRRVAGSRTSWACGLVLVYRHSHDHYFNPAAAATCEALPFPFINEETEL